MAYPDETHKKRRANGEEIAGKNLHDEVSVNSNLSLPERAVYGVIGVMLTLVITRIILRLAGLEDSNIGSIVDGLTDPYVWVFNSLFTTTPWLLLANVEPGSVVSLFFFPLLGWAVLGLINEIQNGKFYRVSRSKIRR